jgi:hypothetical protein
MKRPKCGQFSHKMHIDHGDVHENFFVAIFLQLEICFLGGGSIRTPRAELNFCYFPPF